MNLLLATQWASDSDLGTPALVPAILLFAVIFGIIGFLVVCSMRNAIKRRREE